VYILRWYSVLCFFPEPLFRIRPSCPHEQRIGPKDVAHIFFAIHVSFPVTIRLKKRHLRYDSDSIGLGRSSNGCVCVPLHETLIGLGWFHEQNHDWWTRRCANSSILTPWLFGIMGGTGSVFSSAVNEDGHLIAFHQWKFWNSFWKRLSIRIYFAAVKQFPYCAERLWWISAPGMPLAHKTQITGNSCFYLLAK
jgi:hypothetical protein